jgi:purine-nucleoside phosphorylase
MREAADYLGERIGSVPSVALTLGSGLGGLAEEMESPTAIPYANIPHFPVSTAPGHAGRLVAGMLAGIPALVLQGRFHFFEGYAPERIAFPVRVLASLGVRILFLTNAAGGVNESFAPGDFMLISDHIFLSGHNPCIGPNDDAIGSRFFDMTTAYDPVLRGRARAVAQRLGIPVREGVYMWFAGPSFETPAEIRAARVLGADAVGMSTVPETIAAVHCGLRVLGVSCITNMAAGIAKGRITAEEVLAISEREKSRFSALVGGTVAEIARA